MRMILILSFGGSLRKWLDTGLLTREIEIYLQYLAQGIVDRLYIFSYDHDDDVGLIEAPADLLQRIELVLPKRPLRGLLSQLLYSLNLRRMWKIRGKGVVVAKTNQVSGSWVALLLRLCGIRIFARCGYLLSDRHHRSRNYLALLISTSLEWLLFSVADIVSASTESAARTIRNRVGGVEKVFVAPTYVDTGIFKGDVTAKTIDDAIIFVGRLEPVKNVENLVGACRASGMALHIIGSGSLEARIHELAAGIGADVRTTRVMPNTEIAQLFKSYKYYALTSRFEALPKSLIEAMSSEMICIGTKVPGITALLTDGVTGYLAEGMDETAISEAIDRARSDPSNVDVAKAARSFVEGRHSVQAYLARERAALDRWIRPKIVSPHPRKSC
jgi:glycosyltransferase involved in cell wall biosynthesis